VRSLCRRIRKTRSLIYVCCRPTSEAGKRSANGRPEASVVCDQDATRSDRVTTCNVQTRRGQKTVVRPKHLAVENDRKSFRRKCFVQKMQNLGLKPFLEKCTGKIEILSTCCWKSVASVVGELQLLVSPSFLNQRRRCNDEDVVVVGIVGVRACVSSQIQPDPSPA